MAVLDNRTIDISLRTALKTRKKRGPIFPKTDEETRTYTVGRGTQNAPWLIVLGSVGRVLQDPPMMQTPREMATLRASWQATS